MTRKELERKLQEFIKKYDGLTKGYPTDSQYKGECLSIVKLYIKEVFGILPPPSGSNSAYGYWSNFPSPLGDTFRKVTNTPQGVPLAGDIIIWKPTSSNAYGHIEIFLEGTDKTFKSFGQNWGGRHSHLTSHYYTNVVGWLTPINLKEDMNQDQTRALEALERFKVEEKHGNLEGAVNALVGAYKDLQTLRKEVDSLKQSVSDLEKMVNEINQRLTDKEKDLASYQKELTSANKTLAKKEEEIEVLTKERSDYKRWYESALDKTADKLTSWELLQLLISKLTWTKSNK